MSKCANCDRKIRLATDSAWQKFHPVKATFCRACFREAASYGHSKVQEREPA